MPTAIELREKRARSVEAAREIFRKAELDGDRDMSAEEETQYDKIDKEIRSFDTKIDRIELLEKREKSLTEPAGDDPPRNTPDKKEDAAEFRDAGPRGKKEYRSAYNTYLRGGQTALSSDHVKAFREVRALQIGDNAEGGYLVPDEMNRQLVAKLEEENIARTLATVIPSSTGNMEIAAENTRGAAAWTAEEAAYNEDDDAFAQVLLGAHKATRIIKVSEELLSDSVFPIEGYLANSFARSFGDLEETAFFVGDGSGKPTGCLISSGLGQTAAGVAAITGDEMIDLYHSLGPSYRKRGTFTAADLTISALRKLKDSGTPGQYLWEPGLKAGEPSTFLGRPIHGVADMPAMTTGLKSVLFADWSFYWIADRSGRTFKRLNELYAANGQIGFAAMQRVDGKLTIAEAAKHLIQA